MTATNLRDPATFRKVYEDHSKGLFNLAYRLLSDRQWAEDVLQETYVRAYTRADTFKEGGKVSTWLYRICMNLCYDHLRARRYRNMASLDAPIAGSDAEAPTTWSATLESGVPEAALSAESRDAAATVRRFVDELPEREKAVVVLHQYHEMTFEEIGEVLGLTSRTAQNCLRRAKEKLYFQLKAAGLAPSGS